MRLFWWLYYSVKGTSMEELQSEEDLARVMEASRERPVFLFKHSTACPISAAACREVESYRDATGDAGRPDIYMVKVIESRPISNQIAEDLGVPHRSPQLILVKNGQAVWNGSHHGINRTTIAEAARAHMPAA